MTEPDPDHFEMRRLESLSNTVFGVAMTLLAYNLPRTGGLPTNPAYHDIYLLYAQPLSALSLGFIVAGVFWFSHQRRLATQPWASRVVVFFNLLFLLLIVLLPATTSLYGAYLPSQAVTVLYGLHLLLIAALNAGLWAIIPRLGGFRPELLRATFPVIVFAIGTVMALIAPTYAQYSWFIAFGGLFIPRSKHTRPQAS